MNTKQINKLFCMNPTFKGVFACDQLRLLKFKAPFALIVNTDPSSKPGTHWVAIVCDKRRHIEFFDSFGELPTVRNIQQYIKRSSKSSCYSTTQLQSVRSISCGLFAIGFIKARFRGLTLDDFINLFDQKNLRQNDILIDEFVSRCKAYKNVA